MRGLLVAGALLLLLGGRRGVPFTFKQIARSSAASLLGIDNSVPAHLHARARGLCIVAGDLRARGLIITSAYRSPMLNAAIAFMNANPGVTPDLSQIAPSSESRPHVACIALDLDRVPNDIARTRSLMLSSPHAHAVRNEGGQGLNEGNHLHVEFDAGYLESLDDGVRR